MGIAGYAGHLAGTRGINYVRVTRRVLRAALNYKTDKFILRDTGQASGIPDA